MNWKLSGQERREEFKKPGILGITVMFWRIIHSQEYNFLPLQLISVQTKRYNSCFIQPF